MAQKKLRLLVDAHVFDDPFQGTRTYLKGLYKAAISKAPSIHFVFVAYDIKNLEEEFGFHSNVEFVKLVSRNRIIRMGFDIPRIILKHKIDVSHFQYTAPFIKFGKEIITIHDLLFIDYPQYFPPLYRKLRFPLFKKAAKRADLLLTVSNYAKLSVGRHFHIPLDKIHVVSNGVDHSLAIGHKKKFDNPFTPYILYVSRVEPRKNHLSLITAFCELELGKKGYHLICIGKKDIEHIPLQTYFENLDDDVKSNIHFLQNISSADLLQYYNNASLFVYPSLAEGFGIPPLEAALAGVPVLCSNSTAMSDFVFFGESLFNPMNVAELKEKMLEVLSGTSTIEFGVIKSHIVEKYNWDKIADGYLMLVNDTFSQNK